MLREFIKRVIEFIVKFILKIVFRLEVKGLDKIPNEGPLLILSNHHSYLDPPAIIVSFPREIHFVAKKELFENFFTKFFVNMWDCIPVDRGTPKPSTFKKIFKYLEEGKAVAIFPEGTRVKNPEQFGKAQEGVNYILSKTKVPVLLLKIEGTYQWYKKFKITINIKDIISQEEISKMSDTNLADFLMKKIYEN
ncbi:MAG: lysophospholipid acyltransferase family protein [bacterium]